MHVSYRLFRPLLLLLALFCVLCITSLCLPGPLFAQRETQPLSDWKFAPYVPLEEGPQKTGFDDSSWQTVAVPHTWNSKTETTTHQAAWYRTHFTLPAAPANRQVFVAFEGAAAVADVYLNGVFLGQHRGAYTRFVFRGTQAAVFGGQNTLAVRCDNDPVDTADCLPSGSAFQLYHVYGGLYRPVRVMTTGPIFIDPTEDGAPGVSLHTPSVRASGADLVMETRLRSGSSAAQAVTVTQTVRSGEGRVVGTLARTLTVRAGASAVVTQPLHLVKPHLWSIRDPFLYSVETTTTVGGQVTDRTTARTGFRFFRMTPTGFFLNGVLTPLRGVAKHQETEERASAVTEDDLRRDWADLRDLGVNFVRLAHYPHAQLEYDLADEMGIVVWAENGHSNLAPATATGDRITREMVRQNENHPSICFWSVGNEAVQTKADIQILERYAHVVRGLDKTRLITYASNTRFYESPALDFVAVNRYSGWYGGRISDFAAQAARYHYISETGAGGVLSTHTTNPVPTHSINLYEPEEYGQEFAESRCRTVFRDLSTQIPLFTWWTFRDFGDRRYKGLNTKGLETDAGFRKDVWYLFQTFLRPDTPIVHLCGKPWFLRRREVPSDPLSLKAYSNAPALTLTINGKAQGERRNGKYLLPHGGSSANVFVWEDALVPGRNEVIVQDGAGHADRSVMYAEQGERDGLVRDLSSSNRDNPAYFLDLPVQPEWPVYADFDGTADNTFHDIPAALQGASPIVTNRFSPEMQTTLTFTLAPDAPPTDVFALWTPEPGLPAPELPGFSDTGLRGVWRDNAMNLVPYAVSRRTISAGTRVRIPAAARDLSILLKPHLPAEPAAAPASARFLPPPVPRKSEPQSGRQTPAPAPVSHAWYDRSANARHTPAETQAGRSTAASSKERRQGGAAGQAGGRSLPPVVFFA